MSIRRFGSGKESAKITKALLKELTAEDGPSSEYDLDLRSRDIKKITCLEMLPKIRSLNLAYNEIERIENIEKLQQLQKLQLFSNKLNKCDGLSSNVNLKILLLHENEIVEIDEGMQRLVNLETLRLGRNKIKRIQNLKACVKLSSLDMCHNCLTTTEGLPPLVTLTELNLSNNQITGLKSISRCNSLLELDISFNKLETLLPLKRCKKLKQLNVSGNGFHTWKVLPTLPQLRELYLNDNNLSSIPKGFHKRLPVLDVLELMNNQFTEIRALLPLAKSTNLCELSVANNKVCQKIEFAAKVAKKLPSLKVLDGDVVCKPPLGASTAGARPDRAPTPRRKSPRRREGKSPRPSTASRSRPTLKSAHGRRPAKAAMLPLEKLDSNKEGFRSMLARLRENVKGLDRLCSREQLAKRIELYHANTTSHATGGEAAPIAKDDAPEPSSLERPASADTSERRRPLSSGGMLRNALQFSKAKPKSQFYYRNKPDRQVSSPRSTGSADTSMLLRPKSVPSEHMSSPTMGNVPLVDASDRFDNAWNEVASCVYTSAEARPTSAPSEVNARDSEHIIRFVNRKTADKRKTLRKTRGRGLRKFKIPISVKTALSNEEL